jgi:hypothetical protein
MSADRVDRGSYGPDEVALFGVKTRTGIILPLEHSSHIVNLSGLSDRHPC